MNQKSSGFLKVFKFSYIQNMKSKSTLITMLVFVIIGLLIFPIKSITKGIKGDSNDKVQIDKLYVYVEDDKLFECIKDNLKDASEVERIDEPASKSVIESLKESEDNQVYLEVSFSKEIESEDFGLQYKVVYGKAKDSKDAAQSLTGNIREANKNILYQYYEVSEDVQNNLKESTYEVKMFDENGKEIADDNGLNNFEYWFTYSVIMVLVIVLSFSGSMVAEGIVGEKANRVIEYIMVNLKPMDLILGKIVSGIAVFMTIFTSLIASVVVSSLFNSAVIDTDAKNVFDYINDLVNSGELVEFNALSVLFFILFIILGLYFYGVVSGLCGGMVSKVEEMAEGLKIFTFMLMIGAYLPLFMSMSSNLSSSGWGAFQYVVFLLPISSPFIVPTYFLLGKVNAGIAFGAIAILFVCSLLLTLLASRIFGQMLYHNGSPLKLKDIISLSKGSKKKEVE